MSALDQHYQLREELKEIEHQDELRKRLIETSVCQLFALTRMPSESGESTASYPKETGDLKKKINEYELTINRLKQEHSTKVKICEARNEALRDEVRRLKNQVSKITAIQAAVARDRHGSIFSSPPPAFPKEGSFSPIDDAIGSSEPPEGPPRKSLGDLDRPPRSRSPSSDFTPNRKVYNLLKPEKKPTVANKLQNIAEKAKKRGKISIGLLERPKSKSLGLEDDSLNSLSYYQDGNFMNDDSPPKKRSINAVTPAFSLEPLKQPLKKKKNVFTID